MNKAQIKLNKPIGSESVNGRRQGGFGKTLMGFLLLLLAALSALTFFTALGKPQDSAKITVISPSRETLRRTLTTTAIVTPRNRLEVRPPVAGRLEQMLVKEGDFVKAGQPLATLSSTDRATLIDAARGQGQKEWEYWQQVYKPIQLVSPMDATVIVATLQPGQVVSTTDAIVVLSDRLIVQAQADETDIGKIKVGQLAVVTLDSFPESPVEAIVEHIYYESVVSSNVTVYKVDLDCGAAEASNEAGRKIPDFFRSGMNAQVAFVLEQKEKALVLPADAVNLSAGTGTVVILNDKGKEETVAVKTGITTDNKVEILSGLAPDAQVVLGANKLNLSIPAGGQNPFMPQFKSRSGGK